MIANLFEEYKFFSKYPERQLKIAAVLFGKAVWRILIILCIICCTSFYILSILSLKLVFSLLCISFLKALALFVTRHAWIAYLVDVFVAVLFLCVYFILIRLVE